MHRDSMTPLTFRIHRPGSVVQIRVAPLQWSIFCTPANYFLNEPFPRGLLGGEFAQQLDETFCEGSKQYKQSKALFW